jgi:multidrug transporter EmrE-like cation transporter
MPAGVYVAVTVLLTVYGQIIVKWQVDGAGEVPESTSGKLHYVLSLLAQPWVLTALLAAAIAAGSWMLALTRLDLSVAYPFVGLSFVLVLVASAVFFNEPLTTPRVAGIGLVVLGLILGSR